MSESQETDVEREAQEPVQVPATGSECMRLTESFLVDSRNRFANIQKVRSQASSWQH